MFFLCAAAMGLLPPSLKPPIAPPKHSVFGSEKRYIPATSQWVFLWYVECDARAPPTTCMLIVVCSNQVGHATQAWKQQGRAALVDFGTRYSSYCRRYGKRERQVESMRYANRSDHERVFWGTSACLYQRRFAWVDFISCFCACVRSHMYMHRSVTYMSSTLDV